MITTRTETQQHRVSYGNRLGYVYCAACHKDGIGNDCERSTDHGMGRAEEWDVACNGCSATLAHSFEPVEVTMVIEHVTCKIF
jgi:hypothetical protein